MSTVGIHDCLGALLLDLVLLFSLIGLASVPKLKSFPCQRSLPKIRILSYRNLHRHPYPATSENRKTGHEYLLLLLRDRLLR